MNKRQFLKTSGALLSSNLLSRLAKAEMDTTTRTNWAKNLTYSTDRLYLPESVDEARKIIKSCKKIKALGARHSFNNIADSTANQISLKHFGQMDLDAKSRTITVGGGVKYGDLCPYLDEHGFMVHNLASLPHVTVAGACATGTHGSGNLNGNLSTAVTALEFITADGEMVTASRKQDGEKFEGMVVALGGLGVVTKVTLGVQPAFQMTQVVYENLPFKHLENHLDEIFSSGYSVSLFTDWQNHQASEVWIKRRYEAGTSSDLGLEFFDAKRAIKKLHPIAALSAEACTEQMDIPGPWYERLPHFKMNFTPSSGDELQSEYFVPRDKGYEAIRAVEELRDRITPHLLITELRTIDADNLWMSPCYKRQSMTIHFTWKPEWPAVRELLPQIEVKLEPFQVRPHWAKLFTMSPARLGSRHEKLADFQKLLAQYDPRGKFRNEFLNKNIFGV
jgi:alditol oxidase